MQILYCKHCRRLCCLSVIVCPFLRLVLGLRYFTPGIMGTFSRGTFFSKFSNLTPQGQFLTFFDLLSKERCCFFRLVQSPRLGSIHILRDANLAHFWPPLPPRWQPGDKWVRSPLPPVTRHCFLGSSCMCICISYVVSYPREGSLRCNKTDRWLMRNWPF